ncbi:MAG: hypothetical protein GY699_17820 [Desulfobacteraceae bacterium]|nr:hypothetical protein [Desulfobacteraceae bacterium]
MKTINVISVFGLIMFCMFETVGAGIIHTANYNGHAYHLLDTDGTKWWHEAEAEAVSLGGHLVTIDDAGENQWVFNTFGPQAIAYANANNLPDRNNISLWIGLTDHLVEGSYQWSSGDPIGYFNWASGQPQNGVPDEDFVGIVVSPWAPSKWHDIVGDTREIDLPFGIVEAPVPIPGAIWMLSSGLAVLIVTRRSKK